MLSSYLLPPNPADGFVPFKDYVKDRPQFFPCPSSANYFMRWQRDILLETGVLLSTTAGDWVLADVIDTYILWLSRAGKCFKSDALHDELREERAVLKNLDLLSQSEVSL